MVRAGARFVPHGRARKQAFAPEVGGFAADAPAEARPREPGRCYFSFEAAFDSLARLASSGSLGSITASFFSSAMICARKPSTCCW
jgi:hypothetical protein